MSKRRVLIVLAMVLGCVALLFLWPDSPDAKRAAGQDSQSQADTAAARRAKAGKRALPSHPLKLSGASSGRIVDSKRQGIPGAQVCAVSFADASTNEDQHVPNCVLADTLGRFSFPALWAGTHSIEASARGYLPSNDIEDAALTNAWAGDLELEEGQERDDIVIVLTPGGVELLGHVTDVGGGPIAGAWVELHPQSKSGRTLPTASTRAMSDAEGVVRFWVGKRSYMVEASAEGYVKERSELVVPGMSLEVALVPGSTLGGSVVYGVEGEPAAYARVSASPENGGSYTARADDRGEFMFTRLPAGRYQVSADSDDGRGVAPRSVVVGLGQDVDGVVVHLEPGVRIAGKVVRDGSDEPCEKASGRLFAEVGLRAGSKAGSETGEIQFDNVPPGTFHLVVNCDEGTSERQGAIEVGSENLLDQTWTVKVGLSLRVLVRDVAGAGVPHADVRISEVSQKDIFSRGGGFGQSDDEGAATIRSLSKGKLKAEVYADGLVMKDGAPEIELEGEGQELTVVMTGGGSIAGLVRASTGELPKGLVVMARPETDDDPFARMMSNKAMVLDDGSFRLDGLAAGFYRLEVMADRRSFQSIDTKEEDRYEVSLSSVSDARLTIEGQTDSISGQVVDSRGNAVVDAFVRVVQDPGDEMRGFAAMQLRDSFFGKDASLTDAQGRFEVHQLPEGPYIVRAYRRGGGEAIEKGAAEGSELTLTIVDTGSIKGTVLSSTGDPIKNYSVSCRNTKSEFEREERFGGAEGQFSIDDLPPGSYVVSVTASEGTAVSEEVSLEAAGVIDGVILRLRASGTLVGRLVSLADGSPVEGMRLSAHSTQGALRAGSFMDNNATGADGRFEIKDVPAGPVVVQGFAGGGLAKGGGWGPLAAHAEMLPGGEVDLGNLVVAKMRTSYAEAGDLGFQLQKNLLEGERDLIVGAVEQQGPAHEAGLRTGDQIVAIDGHDLTGDNGHLFYALAMVPAGTTVRLGLEDGKELSITAIARKSE